MAIVRILVVIQQNVSKFILLGIVSGGLKVKLKEEEEKVTLSVTKNNLKMETIIRWNFRTDLYNNKIMSYILLMERIF